VRAEIRLKARIERDIALVVAKQVKLHVVRTGAGEVKVVERVAVRRDHGRVGNAVRVLPSGGLRGQEGAQRIAVGLRGTFPIGSDRLPTVT